MNWFKNIFKTYNKNNTIYRKVDMNCENEFVFRGGYTVGGLNCDFFTARKDEPFIDTEDRIINEVKKHYNKLELSYQSLQECIDINVKMFRSNLIFTIEEGYYDSEGLFNGSVYETSKHYDSIILLLDKVMSDIEYKLGVSKNIWIKENDYSWYNEKNESYIKIILRPLENGKWKIK